MKIEIIKLNVLYKLKMYKNNLSAAKRKGGYGLSSLSFKLID